MEREEDEDDSNTQYSSTSQWTFLQEILLPNDTLSSDICIQTIGNHKGMYVAYEVSSVVSIFQLCIDFAAVTRVLQSDGGVLTEDLIMRLEKISIDFYSCDSNTGGNTSKLFIFYTCIDTHVKILYL